MKLARNLTQQLNTADRQDFPQINRIVRELFGRADETTFLNPPFYCDYGNQIFVGKNCFINYNCTILDNAVVTMGDNCMPAPNVSIYTAGNPCRVIRQITEADKPYYFKTRRIDTETMEKIFGIE